MSQWNLQNILLLCIYHTFQKNSLLQLYMSKKWLVLMHSGVNITAHSQVVSNAFNKISLIQICTNEYCIRVFAACVSSCTTFHRSRTALSTSFRWCGVILCVWLLFIPVLTVCSFKWSLSVLTCRHIYQSACVGGANRISILLFSHNCLLTHSQRE